MIKLLFVISLIIPSSLEEKKIYEYFQNNKTTTGLILDRESDRNIVSVAATGFGMYCWAIAVDKNELDRTKAIEYINKAIDNTILNNPKKNRGWLYHFTDLNGKQVNDSEVSTIDTAIFWNSAKLAAYRLKDEKLIIKVEKLISEIDTEWIIDNGLFRHGLHWHGETPVFIKCRWDTYSEGIILYKLFDKAFKPIKTEYDLPLFVYYYPLCFYNDKEIKDNLVKAVEWQKDNYGYWGVTACDGPKGYEVNNRDIVSPLSIYSVSKYVSQAFEELSKLPVEKTTSAFHVKTKWTTNDKIGIDYGCCYILLNK